MVGKRYHGTRRARYALSVTFPDLLETMVPPVSTYNGDSQG
jgi:hypothetical protein